MHMLKIQLGDVIMFCQRVKFLLRLFSFSLMQGKIDSGVMETAIQRQKRMDVCFIWSILQSASDTVNDLRYFSNTAPKMVL